MTFAELLKKIREEKELSREELASKSGLARGTVRDYEQGKRKPTLESGFKLARAMGVSVEAFGECVEGEPKPPTRKPATRAKGKARKAKGA